MSQEGGAGRGDDYYCQVRQVTQPGVNEREIAYPRITDEKKYDERPFRLQNDKFRETHEILDATARVSAAAASLCLRRLWPALDSREAFWRIGWRGRSAARSESVASGLGDGDKAADIVWRDWDGSAPVGSVGGGDYDGDDTRRLADVVNDGQDGGGGRQRKDLGFG